MRIADSKHSNLIGTDTFKKSVKTNATAPRNNKTKTNIIRFAAQTENTNSKEFIDPRTYYPNKLMLCTVMGLVALFTSVLSLIPSVLSLHMVNELLLVLSPNDVLQARQLCKAAVIINSIEVLAGIIIGIVILVNM